MAFHAALRVPSSNAEQHAGLDAGSDATGRSLRLWMPAEVLPDLQQYLQGQSLDDLKATRVQGSERVYSFGCCPSLEEHCRMLAREFVGRSELEFYHALLTVLIRRQLVGSEPVRRFLHLWETETDFLVTHLDSRWLVSACDTLCDHASEGSERALALSVVLTVNTIKLYETERMLARDSMPEPAAGGNAPPPGRLELFDGLSVFMAGSGDMVANLYRRATGLANQISGPAGRILLEILTRLKTQPTAYKRFRDCHVNPATLW
jgi:hypothetical protein